MRGVASQGMMISAEELALPPEWFEDGIMQLDADVEPGLDAVKLFGLDDDVLDVEITTNRPDAMSMIGLARELAASYGTALRLPRFANPGNAPEAVRSSAVRRHRIRRLHAVRRATFRRRRGGAGAGLDARASRARRPTADQ